MRVQPTAPPARWAPVRWPNASAERSTDSWPSWPVGEKPWRKMKKYGEKCVFWVFFGTKNVKFEKKNGTEAPHHSV